MSDSTSWIRCRFSLDIDHEDYRPVKWPPPGPYWCTGYGPDGPIIVAYLKSEDQIRELWPEAFDVDAEARDEITFTDRFPEPDWWNS